MRRSLLLLTLLCVSFAIAPPRAMAAEPDKLAKPPLKITPGKAIVPTDRMQRPWGELISLDLKNRTGRFRREAGQEVVEFTVLPYAELLHHASFGDLQDFRVGERAIFRLHENEQGEWALLTYIQDEMNMMHGHKEFFHVDRVDPEKGMIFCTWANADKSFIRDKEVVVETDPATRYWKAGEPAKFADIQVGDKLRTKTHGVGEGKRRVAWEMFLDEESLLKFQTKQKAVHAQRMQEEGLPGYIDRSADGELQLSLFLETRDLVGKLKVGQAVRAAPAGLDRKPTAEPVSGTITAVKGREVTLRLSPTETVFKPTDVARMWLGNP